MPDKKGSNNLFKRLTRLFRSGPVVKRKVRTIDTTVAMPDKTKSSAVQLFQRSLGPTYSHITSNAYNMQERMSRYQDFNEMEYTAEINSAMDIYCLTGDSQVHTPEGLFTIIELLMKQERNEAPFGVGCYDNANPVASIEQGNQGCRDNGLASFPVYCYDEANKRITIGRAHSVRKTGTNVPVVKVTLDNGNSIRCTPGHRFMLRSGQWVKAKDLKPGTALMPFKTKMLGGKGYEYPYIYTMDRTKTRSGWRAQHLFNVETQIRELLENEVVHHKNFEHCDNRLENLQIMDAFEHSSYHASLNNRNKFGKPNDAHSDWMFENNPSAVRELSLDEMLLDRHLSLMEFMEKHSLSYATVQARVRKHGYENWHAFGVGKRTAETQQMRVATNTLSTDTIRTAYLPGMSKSQLCIKLGCTVNVLDKFLSRKLKVSWSSFVQGIGGQALGSGGRPLGTYTTDVTYQDICNVVKPGKYVTKEELAKHFNVSSSVIMNRLEAQGFKCYSEWMTSYNNDKVVSVEPDGSEDVYDITTDVYHNFACNGVIVHNSDETVAQDEKGRTLHVYSNNPKIKSLLEDLLYNTLNVEFNLRPWTRNLVKYGDAFFYNDVSQQHGVINMIPIPVNEIEREEGYDKDDPMAYRFRWVTLGNKVLENWEVTHMRLLGNDMFLPYGSSVLEGARRIWRQLILIEDAMLVYRIVRSPERRVFYIDVGNTPTDEIPHYLEQAKATLRSQQVIDKNTGRVDLRYNPLCLSMNTGIKLQDGRLLRLDELINEWNSGKQDQWVYSIDPVNKRPVPGKVIWAGMTRKNAELVRVHLDDGSYVDTTPDHKWMLRDGTYQEASLLEPGQSLMPLYTKRSSKATGQAIDDYPMQLNQFTGRWEYVHHANARIALSSERRDVQVKTDWTKNKTLVVHHKNFDKGDASPSNLQWMGDTDHNAYHAKLAADNIIRYNKSDAHRTRTAEVNVRDQKAQRMGEAYNGTELHASHNEARREAQNKSWSEDKEKRSSAMRWNIPEVFFERAREVLVSNPKMGCVKLHSELTKDAALMNLLVSSQTTKRDAKKFSTGAWTGELVRRGYEGGFKGFKDAIVAKRNHKVVRVERLEQHEDTGCITVEKYRNFAACGTSSDGLGLAPNSLIYLHNSVDEDYFIAVRGNETGTKIDTLQGGQNTAAVEDVQYIQNKLFAALKVPKAYLGYTEMLSSKATLAQEDIRFSRTVNMIQRTIISELNKAAIIHLYANGWEGDDLLNFTLRLSNPSTVAQQQKLELFRTKFEIAGTAPEGLLSRDFLRRTVLGLTDEEIIQIERELLEDAAGAQAREAAEAGGSGGGGGGGGGGPSGGGLPPPGGEEGDLGEPGGLESGPGDEAPPLGGDQTGAVEPPPEEEELPPENAGEFGTDNVILDNDDPEPFGEPIRLSMKDENAPIKVQTQLQRTLYNRGRRRTHGASKTHMPDFNKMTGNNSREMKDPYDREWLRSAVKNPLADTHTEAYRGNIPTLSPSLTKDVTEMLGRMAKRFGKALDVGGSSPLITEAIDEIDDIDVLIEDDGAEE
jgi:hypothetical protein